jgi:hypothetical protein
VNNVIDMQLAQLLRDSGFVSDLARFRENLLTEKFIRKKYGNLDEACWTRLGESDELVAAVEAESYRRIRDGSSKREKAQKHVLAAPDVAASIMNDRAARECRGRSFRLSPSLCRRSRLSLGWLPARFFSSPIHGSS